MQDIQSFAGTVPVGRAGLAEAARTLLAVFKMRIGVAIMLCALAGVAASPGEAPGLAALVTLALAVLLSSAAAGAYNQYAERDLDARMGRTRRRPFVTGRYRVSWRWPAAIFALLCLAVAAAWLATNAVAAVYVCLGAVTYGVVYTVWLKRLTWLNIVFGGLAGTFAVLAGAAAVDPALAPEPVVLAVVLFLWTPPHFWSLAFAYREDYRAAGVPMLPVVVGGRTAALVIFGHTLLLTALALVPGLLGLGWVYLAGALLGGAWFLRAAWRFVAHPDTRHAMRTFHASLGQLGLLLACTVLDRCLLG